MLFGLEGCTGDLLDTSPSYSFSSSNVWTSPILARAAVMGVYNELYEKFSKNYDSPSIGIPFDAWSSVMDIDMNWKNNCFVISGSCTPSNGNVGNHYKYYYILSYFSLCLSILCRYILYKYHILNNIIYINIR